MGTLFVASGIKWKRALGIQPGALFYEKMQLDLFTNINYSQLWIFHSKRPLKIGLN